MEENGQRNQEALNKVASLEPEVAKCRATAWTVWRGRVVWANHQLLSRVDDVLAMLLRIRLDGDEVFERCKDLLKERNDLASRVEHTVEEKEEHTATMVKYAKVIADLQAQLKEAQSKINESKLEATKEKETNKKLEKELLVFKKEVMEQHEKGFYKAIRQVKFFSKGPDLSLFDPFKDVKDNELHNEEDIDVGEEDVGEEKDDGANV